MKRPVLVLCLMLVAACGPAGTTSVAQNGLPSQVPSAPASVSPSPDPIPSFSTPEQAMQFLATAWNARDMVSLKRVTNPSSRAALEDMRSEAINLRLKDCTYNRHRKDYDCSFTHDFPANYSGRDHGASYAQAEVPGTASFVVGPALRSGWYMTVLTDCG